MLLRHWRAIASGKSYWHLPQPLGRHFRPHELHGYFNDLRGKAFYEGLTDAEGFPLLTDADGVTYYHPTCLLQKALGHWDVSLEGGVDAERHRAEAFRLGDKIGQLQDENGGWRFDKMLPTLRLSSPYSAMTQGQAISLFCRLYSVSHDDRFLQYARRALSLLLKTVDQGGTHRTIEGGIALEEFCFDPPNTIFNGWVFALFGLHDMLCVENSVEVRDFMDQAKSGLLHAMPRFLATWWSYYDLERNLNSPFYHKLHLAQLQALALTFDEPELKVLARRLARQSESRLLNGYALAIKCVQRLRELPEVVR